MKNTQSLFFQQIKSKVEKDLSFVHEISELLELSYDSTYRRIRGEKELTISELEKLCKHFDISVDTLFQISSKNVIFTYKALEKEKFELDDWLGSVLEDVKRIYSATSKQVIYSAVDIPLIHYFNFPEITAFKEYIWLKTLDPNSNDNQELFSLENASEKVYKIGRKILTTAVKIPTVEIWNEETFNSILRQVGYYWESGYFSLDDDARILCEKLELWLGHLQQQAELGYKFIYGQEPDGIEGNFKLYYNDFIIGDNSICVRTDEIKTTILTYKVLNLLTTEDPLFCKQMEESMEQLIKKSVLISSVSAKERNMYFMAQFKKLDQLKSKINQ